MSQQDNTLSQPPVIVLHQRSANEVFWQAAVTLSDTQLAKTSKLNIRNGTATGQNAEDDAINLGVEAICKMCRDKNIPEPAREDCVIQRIGNE